MTAVEWLVDQMLKQGYFYNNKTLTYTMLDHLQQQAKEMEKQQIENAFFECWKANMPEGFECKLSAKEYYNETYNLSQQDKP
jgi:hypothetical protein